MSCNGNANNTDSEDEDDGIVEALSDNVGQVITVFTQSGGCSGRGFTGLLTEVDDNFIKLITSLPSAPRHPFGISNTNNFCSNRTRLGTAVIIPINKIVSFCFNEE